MTDQQPQTPAPQGEDPHSQQGAQQPAAPQPSAPQPRYLPPGVVPPQGQPPQHVSGGFAPQPGTAAPAQPGPYPQPGQPVAAHPGQQPTAYQPGQPAAYPQPGQSAAAYAGQPVYSGQPAYGAPPAPQYPGYGYPAPYPYAYRQPSGRKFWGLSFLYFIPYVGWIVAPIVAIVLNSGVRHDPSPLVRENARWAANWNLTVLIASVLSFVMMIGSAMAGAATDEAGGNGDAWFPVAMVGLLLMAVVGFAHLIICIVGTVQADRRVFDPVVVIRFFRPVV